MKALIFLGLLALVLTGVESRGAEPTTYRLPRPEIEVLPSGLEVVWFLSPTLPVVDLGVLIKGGSRHDPAGKSGTAEFVAAMLDRGAAGKTVREIADRAERLGASRYASADDDSLNVGVHGLAPDAIELLGLLADMVMHPDFPADEFAKEQGRGLDRWSHLPDSGEALAATAFQRVVANGTPYVRGGVFSARELKAVALEDVRAFHRAQFVPGNAILMVVGRVDKASFRAKVIERFGAWAASTPAVGKKSAKAAPVPTVDPRVAVSKQQILLVDRPGLTQAQVRIGMRSPLAGSPDGPALAVANALVGEYFYSRLNTVIRDKLGLTYGIGSSFGFGREFARWGISSSTRNEAVGQLIERTLGIIKDLRDGPIPESEIQMAKEYLAGSFPLSTATLGAVAARWLGSYFFGLGPTYLEGYVGRIQAVTSAEVLAAVRKHLDPEQMVIVVAGDAKEIEKSLATARAHPLWGKRFKSVKRVPAKDLM